MFIFLQLIKEMLTYEDYQSKENQKKHQLGLLFQEILKWTDPKVFFKYILCEI